MKKRRILLLFITLSITYLLVSCRPSQDQLDIHATKVANQIFGTLTAETTTTNIPIQKKIPTQIKIPTPTSLPNQQNILDFLSKSELEKEKLKLEIEKLSTDSNSIDYKYLIDAGTLLAALCAVAISGWSAFSSLKAQNTWRRNDRFSQLLRELGSEHRPIKLAAVQALSEYESAIPYLINILKIESDEMIISTIKEVLKSNADISLPILVDETTGVYKSHLRIATSLVANGNNRKEIANTLEIDNRVLLDWISSRDGRRLSNQIRKEVSLIDETHREEKRKIETKRLFSEWHKVNYQLRKITDALEELLIRTSRSNQDVRIKNAYLMGLTLFNLDLSGWLFENCTILDTEFNNCDLSGISFINITSRNTSLIKCNLHDSEFIDFELKQGSFKNSKGQRIIIKDAKFFDCDFSGANLRKSEYSNCEFNVINLQASMFSNSKFTESKFYSCNFRASQFEEVKFLDCKILECEFLTASMTRSLFTDMKIYRNRIERSNFNESVFTSSALTSNQIIYSNFSDVKIIQCNMVETNFDDRTDQSNMIIENIVEN